MSSPEIDQGGGDSGPRYFGFVDLAPGWREWPFSDYPKVNGIAWGSLFTYIFEQVFTATFYGIISTILAIGNSVAEAIGWGTDVQVEIISGLGDSFDFYLTKAYAQVGLEEYGLFALPLAIAMILIALYAAQKAADWAFPE